MKSKYFTLLLPSFLVMIYLCSPLFAQLDLKARVAFITPKDAVLANARIDCITVASQAIAWGTGAGLFIERLDGTSVWYNKKNAPFKPQNFPAAVFSGKEIWTAVRTPVEGQGVFRFDGETWTRYHPQINEMLSDLVSCMLVDSKNRLWIGYEERGFDRFVGQEYGKKTLRLFGGVKVKDGLLSGEITSMVESGGFIWIGLNTGLNRYNPDGGEKTSLDKWTYGPNFPAQGVWALTPWGNGKVAVGTDMGLVLPEGEGWKLFGMQDGLKMIPIRALCADGQRLWLGTTSGIQVFEGGKISNLINAESGLPANDVRCLAAVTQSDGSSKIYVGTEKGARIIIYR